MDTVPGTRRWHALAGLLAGLAGGALGVSVAWVLRAGTDPVRAVAGVVRDLTPGPVAETLIGLVGRADKPLLLAGTVLGMLAVCVLAGLLGRRNALLADAVFLLLAAVGLVAIWTQPRARGAVSLAVVVGFVTWVVVLRLLTGLLPGGATSGAGHGRGRVAAEGAAAVARAGSRRGFLVAGVGVVAVSGVALVGARLAGRGRRRVEQARRLLRLPVTTGTVPTGAGVGVSGVAAWRTPTARFYRIDTALVPPEIPPAQWRLRVHGMVRSELVLTYQDLVARTPVERWITLCCVSNEVGGDLIGNAWWSGVPVRDILAEAGVRPGADAVKQTSQDGWTCGTPLAALVDPHRDALLAFAMNGAPLPIEHGFPVRMVVPGLYGYVSATKWLVDLEVTRFDRFEAYWTERGWAEQGPVKTQSRIDVPHASARVAAGRIPIGGVAWAQHTGISRVEFQLDDGPWTAADLGAVAGTDTWVQWGAGVTVAPGEHRLRVRATDRSGARQTARAADPVPDGATGWHQVSFIAES